DQPCKRRRACRMFRGLAAAERGRSHVGCGPSLRLANTRKGPRYCGLTSEPDQKSLRGAFDESRIAAILR
ncbi:MAG: hypothetical protein L3J32_01725, partial [Rhizobiaceae bacterium]|nr:hypothetical protein [Rhizobiaceae bacterium]